MCGLQGSYFEVSRIASRTLHQKKSTCSCPGLSFVSWLFNVSGENFAGIGLCKTIGRFVIDHAVNSLGTRTDKRDDESRANTARLGDAAEGTDN